MSKHPGLNKKTGSWQEKERKKTGAKQSSRPKLRENPGHNKAIRANVPNSHPGLLLRTLEYVSRLQHMISQIGKVLCDPEMISINLM